MPTEQSTQGADGQTTPPAPTAAENAQAPSPQQNQFDARRAFDATNERLNKVAAVVEKLDPAVIAQLAEKLGVSTREAEKQVEAQTPEVRDVVKQELWFTQNDARIQEANKDGRYDAYLKEVGKPELAVRLAEQDLGIKVDTSQQRRQQQISAADGSVDRDGPGPTPFTPTHGIKDEDIQKYGEQAAKVKVYR